jgi:ferrous iron transport protein B
MNREDILELPVYRKIKMIVLLRKVIHQSQSYLKKLCYVLLLVFAFVYFMQNFMINGISLFEWMAKCLSVVFKPLGFGENWIYVASLVSGIVAKEAVAGTFTMLLCQTEMGWISDPGINFIYLVFVSLTIPCVLTCHTIKDKFGLKMMVKSMLFSLLVSYGISWLLYQFIMLF